LMVDLEFDFQKQKNSALSTKSRVWECSITAKQLMIGAVP